MVILCCCDEFILCFVFDLVGMKAVRQRCAVMSWYVDACQLPFLLLVGSYCEQFKVLKSSRNVSASVHHQHCIKLTFSTTEVLQ